MIELFLGIDDTRLLATVRSANLQTARLEDLERGEPRPGLSLAHLECEVQDLSIWLRSKEQFVVVVRGIKSARSIKTAADDMTSLEQFAAQVWV